MLTDEQLASVDGAYPGYFDASAGRGPPFDWPHNEARKQAVQGRELASEKLEPKELELSQEAMHAAAATVEAARRRGDGPIAAVLVMACNRPTYLRRMLTSLLAVHGGDPRFPTVTVSQDGTHVPTADVANEFVGSHGSLFRLWQHPQVGTPKLLKRSDNPAYYRIAAHYKWALDRLFKEEQQQRVIILEDDMVVRVCVALRAHCAHVCVLPFALTPLSPTTHPSLQLAPDFFEYFAAMAPVLDADPGGLWCASSWNDHGQSKFVGDAAAVYRSDFFPGLGWMLTASTWASLTAAWPVAFWDDWMRMNTTRRGRQCLRPEVCRTYNIGRLGASKGQFYNQFLAPVALNTEFVHWTAQNLSFLAHGGRYSELLAALVAAATPVESAPAALSAAASESARDLVFAYGTPGQYTAFATGLGLMKDLKDGQPRGSYQGVVTIRLHGSTRLFIAPTEYVHAARSTLVEAVQADWAAVSGGNQTGGPEEAEDGVDGEAVRHAAPVTVGGQPGQDAL